MFKSYQRFVLSKAAGPHQLKSEGDFHLLHAALGLATEFLELNIAIDPENTKEEVGDLCWYMMLAAKAIDFPVDNLPDSVPSSKQPMRDLAESTEAFLSLVKKQCIYGSPKAEELKVSFFVMWRAYLALVQDFEFAIDEIIAENQDKLNKRYATSFTTQESEDRKDKV